MRYLSLGDTDDISASCHYLEIGGTGIVLDAGMDPNEDGYAAVPPFEALADRPVDHIIITHAHHDHLGALPVIVRKAPHATVHMSKATAMLADVLLPSSARLQKRRLREGSTSATPVFDTEQAEALSYLYEMHNLGADFDLDGLDTQGDVTGRFYHAGHVLGAVGVYMEADEWEEGEVLGAKKAARTLRVFYTSDTSVRPQTILQSAEYPEGPLDVLLLETTLGADPEAEETSRKEQERAFGEAIKRVIGRGGSVLVPVFALGRSQDVLAMIGRFKNRGLIPDETPVFTVGSMRGISAIYDQTRQSTPRLDPDFEVYGVEQRRLPRSEAQLQAAIAEGGIFVVTSGMLFERTPSHSLAQKMIEDEKHGVFFVGYSKEDSPGALLQEKAAAGEPITLHEERGPQTIRAEVARFRFSGHAHRRDLITIVEKTRPKKVVLVHGETEAKVWIKDNIEFFHPEVEVIIPEQGQELEL
ncbi:MAG TPA: MBL fold metallo-hydrolase [Bacteroidetes bacterium]|nr:MBL fold metallo-hydrolase [Bacteroidota bacterium]